MASGASASLDRVDMVAVCRGGQSRGGGVAHGAVVQMHAHRIICRMAACRSDTRRGVGDMAQGASADCRVIDQAMLTCLIMAEQAAGGIGAGADDLLYGYTRARSCFAAGIMTL